MIIAKKKGIEPDAGVEPATLRSRLDQSSDSA
jgi:hypothetical protein